MKRLLPIVALIAVGCLSPGSLKPPTDEVVSKPAEDFVATPAAPLVTASEVTPQNAQEMCRRLQKEIDRDQLDR